MALLADSPWTVVLPVKSLDRAKTRLDPEGQRGSLALAFFHDCLAAVVACPRVGSIIVVTADDVIGSIAERAGAVVVDDAGHPGINAAADWAVGQRGVSAPMAVMVSDLPCLTPEAMAAVLDAAAQAPVSFLSDADGSGTTIWLRSTGTGVDSRFGPQSAAAHLSSGAVDLAALDANATMAPARRDVDTDEDLDRAIRLGVGPHTRAATASETIVTALRMTDEGDLEVADEQGRRLTVGWESVAAAGFREVRPGQRLVVDARTATALRLP